MVQNKLEMKIEKCKFLFKTIEYLGYEISERGIMPTKKGVESVLNFKVPENINELQKFIGLCSYFRKFFDHS